MTDGISQRADFTAIRYAQCWEDADILLRGLEIQPEHNCLSIASAGDNTLAMLSRKPKCVIAIDLSQAQLACLELRVAAYRALEHRELLELIGSIESLRRLHLYRRCREFLSNQSRAFWEARSPEIEQGIGAIGRFENYLRIFRKYILPWLHPPEKIEELVQPKSVAAREEFYAKAWDTWRWRLTFRIFFSRLVMGRVGRDPEFFRYVEGSVAEHFLARARKAGTQLDPSTNPYLQWLLFGQHRTALPFSLRPENFAAIRANLDRLEIRQQSLEEFLRECPSSTIDRFNLSNIFEYLSLEESQKIFERLARAGRSHSRIAYWNLLVRRRRPKAMANKIRPFGQLSEKLSASDQTFFYQAFIVEEMKWEAAGFKVVN